MNSPEQQLRELLRLPRARRFGADRGQYVNQMEKD